MTSSLVTTRYPNGWAAEAAALIQTPLTYNDAWTIAAEAYGIPGGREAVVLGREVGELQAARPVAPSEEVVLVRIAAALLAVDAASRAQAEAPLRSAIAAIGQRCREEGDAVAVHMAAAALGVAR